MPSKRGTSSDAAPRADLHGHEINENAAVAIENARLLGEARVREERLRTLNRVNQVVSASLDLDEVLGAIVRAATELFGGIPAWIWTADAAEQVVESRAFSDPRLHESYPVRRVARNEGFIGWVIAHRTMIEVPNVFVDPRYHPGALGWWQTHGFTSFVGVPIIQDGHLLGVLVRGGPAPASRRRGARAARHAGRPGGARHAQRAPLRGDRGARARGQRAVRRDAAPGGHPDRDEIPFES